MIATITHDQQGPAIRLGSTALERLGVRPGQRVRVDILPLPFTPSTPLMEPEGSR